MSKLIAAIEGFEAALATAGPELCEAESALYEALGREMGPDHDEVCAAYAQGCTEGVAHGGTIYAAGAGPDGCPCVLVLRRVREAGSFRP